MRSGWLAVGLGLILSGSGWAKDITEIIARIQRVGPEGKNNADAAAAWKELVAEGPPALLPILSAYNDRSPIAANWLRPAVDAIADRALSAGKTLPTVELRSFVAATTHNPAARRIAYELLVRVDAQTPERLLPGLLNDPSSELRREAVERVLKSLRSTPDSPERAAAWRKLLDSARDRDQVEEIAKELERLKQPVDLTRHFGFLTEWWLAASFDNVKGVGYAREYPPEKAVDLTAKYTGKEGIEVVWKPVQANDKMGLLDLNKLVGKEKGAVVYAFTRFQISEPRMVQIRLGCISAVKVFLNDKLVFAREEYHHGMDVDQYTVEVPLQKGENRLLVKVCQNEQTEPWAQKWQFQLRLCDELGTAVPVRMLPRKTEKQP